MAITVDSLTELTNDGLEALIYMVRAELQRRVDKQQAERRAEYVLNHQCESLEDIRKCPICCIP